MPKAQAPTPSGLLAAFADPTRLRILNLLRSGEQCVGDLVQLLQVPQSSASRHLAHLRSAGLVDTRKAGLWVYYALAKPVSPFHARLVDCLSCCFQEVPELQSDLERAEELRAVGGCCPQHPEGRAKAKRRQSATRCCP